MKIVILDGYSLNPGDLSWQGFKNLGALDYYDRTPEDLIIERIQDAEIVITNKTPLTRQVFEACQIKYVGVLATGYNVVDIQAATDHEVVVTNIPAYGTQTVAQHTLALLLEVCHHVGKHDLAVKRGQWHQSKDFCFWEKPIIELAGKTLGLIGLGRIGQAVARLAEAFGMKVIAYSKTRKDAFDCQPLEAVLKQSDVISLHCPLTEATREIINTENINKMKTGVIILNTSRGPLIKEDDLYEALVTGKVYAAAIDVLETEPPVKDHKIMTLDNCFITPHIAWASKEARMRLMDMAVNNLTAFITNKPINKVN